MSKPDGWSRTPDSERGFNVVRLHYFFRSRKALGKLFSGEPVADLAVPAGTIREDHEIWTGEVERTEVQSTAQALVAELECASKFATEVGAAAGVPGTGMALDSKVLSEVSARFRQEARVEMSRAETVRTQSTWAYSQKLTVDGSKSNGPLYVQSQYRQRSYDVFLTFADFLFIDYERIRFWQRRRRSKFPPLPDHSHDWRHRPNVTPNLNIPVKTAKFWELVEHRHPVVQGDYVPEVGDPFAVELEELLEEGPTYSMGHTPHLRSLYSYSNDAFLLKWSKTILPVTDE